MIYRTEVTDSTKSKGEHYIQSAIMYPNPATEPESHDIKYIDLGLPSGTLWADRNLGAYNPEDDGMYFSYGEVTGHYDFDDQKPNFNEEDYIGDEKVELTNLTDPAYSYDESTLDYTSMPTEELWQELLLFCDIKVDFNTGVATITGINGNKILMPASAILYDGRKTSYQGAYRVKAFSKEKDGSTWYYGHTCTNTTINVLTGVVTIGFTTSTDSRLYASGMPIRSVKYKEGSNLQTITILFKFASDMVNLCLKYGYSNYSKINIKLNGEPVKNVRLSGNLLLFDFPDGIEKINKGKIYTLEITSDSWYQYTSQEVPGDNCTYGLFTQIYGRTNPTLMFTARAYYVNIDLPKNFIYLTEDMFYDNWLGYRDATINMHNTVVAIGKRAFKDDISHKISPNISELVCLQSIGELAFSNVEFEEFDITNHPKLTSIAGGAFSPSKIHKLVIKDSNLSLSSQFSGVTEVYELVYLGPGSQSGGFLSNNSEIQKITIGKDVTLLQGGFCYYCVPKTLIFEGQTPPSFLHGVNSVMNTLQNNPPSDLVVTVPKGCSDAYKAAIPALADYIVESNK